MKLALLWSWLPAKLAHDFAVGFLKVAGPFLPQKNISWQNFDWRGLHFRSRLGIAGGVDKNGETVEAFWAMGAGFIEVGTVTPLPQGPNPGAILKRFTNQSALWNKMGFPNHGAAVVKKRLSKLKNKKQTPLFVNVGKNRNTSIENASSDYIAVINELKDVADAFVVNISSPNTSQLRSLLEPQNLKKFLHELVAHKGEKPMLLKLSPDVTTDELKTIIDVSYTEGIDGWILTNTTAERKPNDPYPSDGGVSGLPVQAKSESCLQTVIAHLGDRKQNRIIISVGGIMTAEDALKRINMGADLVAVYSTLVLNGPGIFQEVTQL